MVTVADWAAEKAARDVEHEFIGKRHEGHRVGDCVRAKERAEVDSRVNVLWRWEYTRRLCGVSCG